MIKQILTYSLFILALFMTDIKAQQNGSIATFNSAAVPPPNDDLCDAISLDVDDFCGMDFDYSNIDATTQVGEPAGCPLLSNSVWFSFEAPATGYVQISAIDDGSSFDYEIEVFEEVGVFLCTDFSTIASVTCDDNDQITVNGLTPTDTYYIRVQIDGSSGVFCIDITEITPPENDELCDAIALTVDNICVGNPYNNENATYGIGEADVCEPGSGTVWFTFVAPLSGSISVETSGLAFEKIVYEKNNGFSCLTIPPALTMIACASDENGLEICELTPFETYYIRLVSYTLVTSPEFRSSSSFDNEGDYCVWVINGPGPSITLDEAEIEICDGQTASVDLIYTETTNSPTEYSIDYNADANADGLADVGWTAFPMGGSIELAMGNIDFVAAEPQIAGEIAIRNANCEAPPRNFFIDILQPPASAMLSLLGSNEICEGESTTIAVEITGGTGPYTLTYSDGTNSFMEFSYSSNDPLEVFPASNSTYSVTNVTDANGCEATVVMGVEDVTILPNVGGTMIEGGGAICSGSGTAIWFIIPGGTPPYTVEYSDGINNFVVANYESGDPIIVSPTETTEYSPVSVEDFDGCFGGLDGIATVTVFDPITSATLDGGGEICSGGSSEIFFTITGGDAPYEVTYFDGFGFNTVSNYNSGDPIVVMPFSTTIYTAVSIEDANSCGGPVNGMAQVTVNDSPNFANLTGDAVICNGESTDISFEIFGGTAPYYVEYFDGSDIISVSNYMSGDPIMVMPTTTTVYTPVFVEDANNCEADVLDGMVTVTVFEAVTSSVLQDGLPMGEDPEICNGDLWNIYVDITGGTAPYVVTIFDGNIETDYVNYESGDLINVLPIVTTTYSLVSVEDANGCLGLMTNDITIIVNDGPTLSTIDGDGEICIGESFDIFVEINGGTAPYELLISNGMDLIEIFDYQSGDPIPVAPDQSLSYVLEAVIDANDCLSDAIAGAADITVFNGPGDCFIEGETEICLGESAFISFNIEMGTAPYEVIYTDEQEEFVVSNYFNGDLIEVAPTQNTHYLPVSVVDADGCEGDVFGEIAVYVLGGPDGLSFEGGGDICEDGESFVYFFIQGGIPPFTVVYSDGNNNYTEEDYYSEELIYVFPDETTDYMAVSVEDNDGCLVELNDIVTVTVSDGPGLANLSGGGQLCSGDIAEIFVEIESGVGPYTIIYSDGFDEFTVFDYISGDPIEVIVELGSEFTLVDVLDASNCIGDLSGEAIFTVDEGPGLVLFQGNQSICLGDMAELSFEINSGQAPYTITYNDGQADITLENYSSGDPILVNPEATTTYTPISVVDAISCPGSFSGDVMITVNEAPQTAILGGSDAICSDESAFISIMIEGGTPPYSVSYLQDMTEITIDNYFSGDLIEVSPAVTTIYSGLNVTDSNGCVSQLEGSATITVVDYPQISLLDVYCSKDLSFYSLEIISDGDVINIDNGTLIDNGGGMYTISDIPIDLSVQINAENELASCTSQLAINPPDCDCLNVDAPISNGDQLVCDGDQIPELSVTVPVDHTADWYDASTGGNLLLMGSTVYAPMAPGVFYAESRNLNTDCVSLIRTAVEYDVYDNSEVTIEGELNFCLEQGFTTLSVDDSYMAYAWSTGEEGTSIEVTESGEYSIIILDINGCEAKDTVSVTVFDVPEVTIVGESEFCVGDSANLSLDQSFETYSWSNGEDSETINVNVAGNYSVTVTDGNGCEGEASFEVVEIPSFNVEITGDSLLCSGADASLSIEDIYSSYSWSNGEMSSSIQVNTPGNYQVTVTDEFGCTGIGSYQLEESAGEVFETKFLTNQAACVGDTLHFFDITEIVEVADSYLWDFGDGNMSTDRDPTHSYTDPGIYEVQLVATDEDCKNESIIKEVEILACRRDIFDDSNFAFFNISPNPSDGTFKVVIELLLETNVLIELYTINGVLLSSDSYQDKLLSKDYVLTDGGIYFVKVKTPFFSKAKKVFVHK